MYQNGIHYRHSPTLPPLEALWKFHHSIHQPLRWSCSRWPSVIFASVVQRQVPCTYSPILHAHWNVEFILLSIASNLSALYQSRSKTDRFWFDKTDSTWYLYNTQPQYRLWRANDSLSKHRNRWDPYNDNRPVHELVQWRHHWLLVLSMDYPVGSIWTPSRKRTNTVRLRFDKSDSTWYLYNTQGEIPFINP